MFTEEVEDIKPGRSSLVLSLSPLSSPLSLSLSLYNYLPRLLMMPSFSVFWEKFRRRRLVWSYCEERNSQQWLLNGTDNCSKLIKGPVFAKKPSSRYEGLWPYVECILHFPRRRREREFHSPAPGRIVSAGIPLRALSPLSSLSPLYLGPLFCFLRRAWPHF